MLPLERDSLIYQGTEHSQTAILIPTKIFDTKIEILYLLKIFYASQR